VNVISGTSTTAKYQRGFRFQDSSAFHIFKSPASSFICSDTNGLTSSLLEIHGNSPYELGVRNTNARIYEIVDIYALRTL